VTDPAPDRFRLSFNVDEADRGGMPESAGPSQEERLAAPEPPASVGRTAWFRRDTALRRFLRAETGSGAVLLAAAVVALIWVNIDQSSYDQVWHTRLSIQLGHSSLSFDLRGWTNSGLMSFFFLVVGLEARREFDIGEFRDRPRVILPVLAGVGGMLGAVGLYLAINAGRSSVHDWGVAMSTDTAFALGVLAVLGSRVPDRLRGFVLTVTVVDDIVGLVVIATVYTHHITVPRSWSPSASLPSWWSRPGDAFPTVCSTSPWRRSHGWPWSSPVWTRSWWAWRSV
jgi:hypothetical protein